MADSKRKPDMPKEVAAIVEAGFATWAKDDVNPTLRQKFDTGRIPVVGVRHIRVWGIQVDDERELPGHERTQIADEEIWEINLAASNGSKYEVDSRLLKPA